MSTKILALAAVTVLALGAGSAFAQSNMYERAPANAATTTVQAKQGQSAGDTYQMQTPNWVEKNASGGGN